MSNESPTARRARLERLCEEETRQPAVGDHFLDWYSEYMQRCERDAMRYRHLRDNAVMVQAELMVAGRVAPLSVAWCAAEGVSFDAWVDRMAEREVQHA